jgi:hypothetical protein
MSDEQTPRSGSRWEPAPDDETVAQPAPPPVPAEATDREVPPAARADKPGWTQRVRSNGGLVGAGVALVLVGGIGGFAVGHATDGHDRFGLVGEQVPGGPGGGFPGADGQLPPPRHDDDGGLGTPPGSDDDGGGASESGSTL